MDLFGSKIQSHPCQLPTWNWWSWLPLKGIQDELYQQMLEWQNKWHDPNVSPNFCDATNLFQSTDPSWCWSWCRHDSFDYEEGRWLRRMCGHSGHGSWSSSNMMNGMDISNNTHDKSLEKYIRLPPSICNPTCLSYESSTNDDSSQKRGHDDPQNWSVTLLLL